HSTRTE
ncbi:unnamed protein product, partial [Allacma fusca]